MKNGYWVVAYRAITNESAVKEYSRLVGPILEKSGGKAIIRTSDGIQSFEAGLKQRTVVVEFESFEKAVSTYNSDAYRVALAALGSGAERDFRIVEGVD